ncbi:dioxygenase-like protein [Actinocorallia herbida]|uniref:Dioxygenase-like protein n=1 Tax=Actinocorallia herbida TaxID=58109 RepID=A0A3N1CNR2_9ACTN|nr:intradiol ring-cleavage dioxygenase [Actinocorallia herbida]ROO82956.1 dioxygenase-like protein [Actinocorallia herbida]
MTDDHDRGLAFDLSTLMGRRGVLGLIGGAALAGLVGCAAEDKTSATASATAGGGPGGQAPPPGGGGEATPEGEIPNETAGPYPGDGSNGPNVLTQSGIVRSDLRTSFGDASGVAEGVPLTIELTLADDGEPLAGAAVYLWHCDRDGNYSLYSDGITGENYLRGVQEADKKGKVKFTSIFPACYSGRWPHIHFEVYESLKSATTPGTPVKTTQLAFPKAVCDTVFATDGYSASIRNLSEVSLDTDNVFSDGHDLQLATVTGSVAKGYRATLAVPL